MSNFLLNVLLGQTEVRSRAWANCVALNYGTEIEINQVESSKSERDRANLTLRKSNDTTIKDEFGMDSI